MSVTAQSRRPNLDPFRRWLRNMSQARDEVLVRAPGDRIYGEPRPAAQEATNHWECALLSQVAYLKAEEIKAVMVPTASLTSAQRTAVSNQPTAPQARLRDGGWEYLDFFPTAKLDKAFKRVNLRVEVWAKKDRSVIAVAFGGTVATSIADWRANLRWVLPKHKDEYTLTVGSFVPDFVRVLEGLMLPTPPIIWSTGHSLGGGLAQQFAYALPDELSAEGLVMPKVIQVYAFDPSPVTGFYSLKKATRTRNAHELKTDRVFERGEILASLRSLLALITPPSRANPAVRAVRYNYLGITWPIHAHSISQFADGLYGTTHPQESTEKR
jgi:hypothetical protein